MSALPNLITFPEDKQLVGLSNWAVFRDHVKSVARSAGLNGYLDGTITAPISVATVPNVVPVVTPVNSRNPTPEEWELRDACLAGIVFQNIKDPRSIGVTQDMTSNVMWNALTGEYENSSAAAQTLATERIQQCKYTAGTAFEDYFKSLEALRKSANDVGCNITDDNLRSRFLTSLPQDYLWILQNHGARPFPDLKRHLIEYDMMVESVNHTADLAASAAVTSVAAAPVTAAAALYDFSNTEPEGMGKSLHHHSLPDVLASRLEPEATALVNMSENGWSITLVYPRSKSLCAAAAVALMHNKLGKFPCFLMHNQGTIAHSLKATSEPALILLSLHCYLALYYIIISAPFMPTINDPVTTSTPPASSDQPSTSSISQTASKRKKNKGGKRGNKGKFRGPQLEFLQARIGSYHAVSGKSLRSKWIASTTHEYFNLFPWHTQSEPAKYAVLSQPDASLTDNQRQELEDERARHLSVVVQEGQKEIKNWVHRQTQHTSLLNGGRAFRQVNVHLSNAARLKVPRQKPDFKYFMSHPQYQPAFQDHYRAVTSENPPNKATRIKTQCKIAEDLFNRQSDEFKQQIAIENSAAYAARVAAFKKLLSGEGFSMDVSTLTEEDIKIISSGTAQGLKFHEWNKEIFSKQVMDVFMTFLHATGDPEQASANSNSSALLNHPSLISLSDPLNSTELSTRTKRIGKRKAQEDKEEEEEAQESGEEDEEEEYDGGEDDDDNENAGAQDDDEDGDDEGNDGDDADEGRDVDGDDQGQSTLAKHLASRLSSERQKLIHPDALNYLETLPPQKLRPALQKLCQRQSLYNLERESNLLRKEWIFLQITGGRTATDMIFGGTSTPPPPPPPPLPQALPHASAFSQTNSEQNEPPTYSDSPPSPSVLSIPEDELIGTVSLPEQNSPNPATSAPTIISVPEVDPSVASSSAREERVDISDCPKWLSDAYTTLTSEGTPNHPLWRQALRDLVTLERYHEFEDRVISKGSTFSSAGRPKAFSWWFRNRKPIGRLPPTEMFGKTDEFATQWWQWYSIINPEWRERDGSGRIVVNGSGEGEWDEFDLPGQNGMLSLLVSLRWWYHLLPTPSDDWILALRDVSWLISELVRANRPHHNRKRPRPYTNDESCEDHSEDSDSESSFPDQLVDWDSYIETMNREHVTTCAPQFYDSILPPTKRSHSNYQYYWDQPGCYKNWADVVGRVTTGYSGNMHKGYDTYEQALDGWRQHCRGFHKHPPGFVDGTTFVAPEVPKTPPPTIPPPSKINITTFPSPVKPTPVKPQANRNRTAQSSPSSPTPSHPRPVRNFATAGVGSSVPTMRRGHVWAIHSQDFNSVVASSAQADRILQSAVERGEEVEIREVLDVADAEKWFAELALDEYSL
ncbi:hypothetical protein D9757_009965 [Collybiopsis confluens]|uniref:Uncharacterized protein n=1 Tax=Collybiopsis confluens TaxID=2823264 RepID=A0A8H5LZN8_9AGAR|nr:hypothetical protein D9757_009965 [Collybiopsis confluens]